MQDQNLREECFRCSGNFGCEAVAEFASALGVDTPAHWGEPVESVSAKNTKTDGSGDSEWSVHRDLHAKKS